jgi:xanthine dehydrogenase YagS FAD-binding subunit
MINFNYTKAGSVNNAVDLLLKDSKAMFIAGGTNLIDLVKRGITSTEKLIDINKLPLVQIEKTNTNSLRIGAMVTNSDVAENALVQQYFPLLAMAIRAGASPQLRNMATTGGNLMQRTRCAYFYDITMPCNKRAPGTGCAALKGYNRMHAIFGASESCIAVHPSDMCVALAALNARVIVTGSKNERTIPFTDFHRLPGNTPHKDNNLQREELITAIEIPFNNFSKNYYLKIRDRSSYAFALVSVAAALQMNGTLINKVALAMGGVAHKPWRLTAAENFLQGKVADADNFKTAAAIAMKEARSYGRNDFKLKMAPAAIITALMTAANS